MRFKLPGGRVFWIIRFVTLEIWVFLVIKTAGTDWQVIDWWVGMGEDTKSVCFERNWDYKLAKPQHGSAIPAECLLSLELRVRVTLDSFVALNSNWLEQVAH